MHRIEFQSAYILHARLYQETSLLLELFTEDYGRIAVIAKGARRPNSQARGLLQSFVPLLVSCVGRGELLTLKNFDSAGVVHHLPGRQLVSAFYLNELLMRLLARWDAHTDLFQSYRETLIQLEKARDDKNITEQQTLRLFEKNLLKAIGYELRLTEEAGKGHPVKPEADYLYDPEQGPILVEQGAENSRRREEGTFIFKGSSLLALSEEQFQDPQVLLDAKRLMRRALSVHLGYKPLESRRLLRV